MERMGKLVQNHKWLCCPPVEVVKHLVTLNTVTFRSTVSMSFDPSIPTVEAHSGTKNFGAIVVCVSSSFVKVEVNLLD
jgi:hypothetical protein